MIQDIFPSRFNNHYQANRVIDDNDYILFYNENTMLFKNNGDVLSIPKRKDFSEMSDVSENTFLFTLNEVSCFLIWSELKPDSPDFVFKEVNLFRTMKQTETAWVSIVGFHLKNWYIQNRYCGCCGTRTLHKTDERALLCPNCKTTFYPKISPAIIVAIICLDKILLARNTSFKGGWYSLIAGYVDVGETLEETLVREVKEEIGIDVKNIRYYKSQPWPPSGSMMIGFVAEADDSQPIVIDNNEIAEAAWFQRGCLPQHSSDISIAGEMIDKFERGIL